MSPRGLSRVLLWIGNASQPSRDDAWSARTSTLVASNRAAYPTLGHELAEIDSELARRISETAPDLLATPPTHAVPLPPLLDGGKTQREAKRRVKRALARHFYNRLKELQPVALTT